MGIATIASLLVLIYTAGAHALTDADRSFIINALSVGDDQVMDHFDRVGYLHCDQKKTKSEREECRDYEKIGEENERESNMKARQRREKFKREERNRRDRPWDYND